MEECQGGTAVAGLEQVRIGHEQAKVAAPLRVAVNQEYRATWDIPIIFRLRTGQSENSSSETCG